MQKIDYTKYKLKPKEEIVNILEAKNSIFVLSCSKCFKEYISETEPEYEELSKILKETSKNVVGHLPLDFLCNEYLTKKSLNNIIAEINKADAIAVVSCGLGIQTIADLVNPVRELRPLTVLADSGFKPPLACQKGLPPTSSMAFLKGVNKPVFGVTDSINQGGYHGIALSAEKCGACGECYLTLTGGICPIVDCSKGLICGPCGGAKNGKCEISKDKECAWENIYKRLAKQGRTQIFLNEPPRLRDYSKNDFDFVNKFVKTLRQKRYEGFYGGIYPIERKELTANLPIEEFLKPDTVVIPLLQHTGAICEPLVKVGDKVKVGQKIGDSKSFISAPVHSSVSGEVRAIEQRKNPLLQLDCLSVVIKSDKQNSFHESVKPKGSIESLSKEQIIETVKDAGVVGLGGAQFPTYVKLKSPKPIDVVLINGCECEPVLNSDYRIMLERSNELILGTKLIMKAVGVHRGIIAIEDNKPEAINKLKELIRRESDIEIICVKTKYPEGAERMLIKRVLNREVPLGGLPLDVGVIVNNVNTAYAVWSAVYMGVPLIKRVITVAGDNVKKAGNYEILIGTPLSEIMKHCGISLGENLILKMGGPLMGVVQPDFNVSIVKGTTGLITVNKPDIEELEVCCIKCGRCVDVCPVELLPLKFVLLAKENEWEEMEKYGVLNCIECGCCENICSSKSSLISIIKKTKKIIRERKR